MTIVVATSAGQTLTAAAPATAAPPAAQGFASVFAALLGGVIPVASASAAASGARTTVAPPAELSGLGAGSGETFDAEAEVDDEGAILENLEAAPALSTAPLAFARLFGGAALAVEGDAAASSGFGPNAGVVVARGKIAVPSSPATPTEGAPEPDPDAPAAAQAAVALDAGVTRIVGRIAAETPRLETPAAPTPPQVASAIGGEAGKTDADGAMADGAPDASAEAAGVRAASAAADAPSRSPDGDAPAAAGARVEAGATAAREPAAGSQLQTAAAPATPQAATQQAPAATAAVAAHAVTQLSSEIANKAGARRTRFEVRLDPGELGRVDVRLDIGQDGRLSTRLIVERAETLDMLRNDSRELARTLEQAGFQLGQGGLAFQLKDGRQSWRPEAPASRSDASANDGDEASPGPLVYARSGRPLPGGVDVTI